MISSEITRALRSIDWDFAASRTGYIAPPHWYPGTFVPALSDTLIEALTPDGGQVFDPYGGIGTTGWSAVRMGRSPVITDVNPIAILSGYVTTVMLAMKRMDPAIADLVLGTLARLLGRNDDLFGSEAWLEDENRIDECARQICRVIPSEFLDRLVVGEPNVTAMTVWFESGTLDDIEQVLSRLKSSKSAFVTLLGVCMVSAILRSASSQHASWGHIADNVFPKELKSQSLNTAIARWLNRMSKFVRKTEMTPSSEPMSVRVEQRNWALRGQSGPGTADLLLTSPPYADAIDYTLSQRLSLYAMGYEDPDLQKMVGFEIGARRKRTSSRSRLTWSEQLCEALREQVTWVKPTGIVCLLLPHKDAGRSAGEKDLRDTMDSMGWSLFFEQDRSIHQSHTRQSWTSIKRETILAFSRVAA